LDPEGNKGTQRAISKARARKKKHRWGEKELKTHSPRGDVVGEKISFRERRCPQHRKREKAFSQKKGSDP